MEKKFILLLIAILIIPLVIGDSTCPSGVYPCNTNVNFQNPGPSKTITFNNNTGAVNSSEFCNCWTTAEGIKCDVADITYDEISGGDVNALGYFGYFNAITGVVGQLNMDGDPWYLGGTSLELAVNFILDGFVQSDLLPDPTLTLELGSGAQRWLKLWVANISAEQIDTYNIYVSDNLTVGDLITINNRLCNATACFTLQELNATGGSSNVAYLNNSQTFTANQIINGSLKVNGTVAFHNNVPSASTGFINSWTETVSAMVGISNTIINTRSSANPASTTAVSFSAQWQPTVGSTANRNMGTLTGGQASNSIVLNSAEEKNFTITSGGNGYKSSITFSGATTGAGRVIIPAGIIYSHFNANPPVTNAKTDIDMLVGFYDAGQDDAQINHSYGYYGISAQNYMAGNLTVSALNATKLSLPVTVLLPTCATGYNNTFMANATGTYLCTNTVGWKFIG